MPSIASGGSKSKSGGSKSDVHKKVQIATSKEHLTTLRSALRDEAGHDRDVLKGFAAFTAFDRSGLALDVQVADTPSHPLPPPLELALAHSSSTPRTLLNIQHTLLTLLTPPQLLAHIPPLLHSTPPLLQPLCTPSTPRISTSPPHARAHTLLSMPFPSPPSSEAATA